MGPVDIRHDETVTSLVLSHFKEGTLDLSSAYFNITDSYSNAILDCNDSRSVNIITASPEVGRFYTRYLLYLRTASPQQQANGFFNGKGMSGYIPLWYSCMERIFYDKYVAPTRPSLIRCSSLKGTGITERTAH